jgi:serine/threonine protein phosphatase PrpC
MRKLNSKFKTNFISEEGAFLQNKDYFAFIELDDYACYVIADGIDDDKELESAKIAVTAFIRIFTAKPTMNKFIIKKYLKSVNEELILNSRYVRLKASITVVITNYSKLIYSIIGNTRFYLFKDGYLRLKSKDQSLTQELVDKEIIPLDKMSKHAERNNLSSYLGKNDLSNIYVSKKIKLSDGDAFALLTKGIWENCDDKEMEDALEGAKEPKDVTDNIEDMILSRQPKKLENYTLALTFVEKAYINPKQKERIKKIILTAIPILLIITIGLVVFNVKRHQKLNNIATMGECKANAQDYMKDGNIQRSNEEYKKALDIAKKYKLKDDSKTLDEDYKYTEIIMEADKNLEKKKYEDALDKYILALEKAGDTGSIGREYILKKIDIVKNCITVSDLLVLGDKHLEGGDSAAAEANYLEAKKLALDYYLKDEKKEAMDKLQKIYDQKAADAEKEKSDKDKAAADKKQAEDAANKDKEDSKKQEEENAKNAKEEKKAAEELQNKAIDLRKNGDLKYVAGDYVSAKMYYALAKEAFENINSHSLANELQEKITLMDKKINDVSDKKREADQYSQEANKRYVSGDANSAKVLYLLAKDRYNQLGMADEASKVDEKLAIVEKSIGQGQ